MYLGFEFLFRCGRVNHGVQLEAELSQLGLKDLVKAPRTLARIRLRETLLGQHT